VKFRFSGVALDGDVEQRLESLVHISPACAC
jgi:hypothetical protein